MADAVIDVLVRDHREAEEMFTEFESLPPGAHDGRRDLADRVVMELVRHAVAEEMHVIAFTYSTAQPLVDQGIRVNCVAPGPVWTPLIPATMPADKVEQFGGQVPMGRAAHPDEIAPSYVFLAADRLLSYYTGEVLAPVGGETMPG